MSGFFNWKQVFGITSAKRKIAKASGIPTTKAGRKQKAKNVMWKAIFGSGKKK